MVYLDRIYTRTGDAGETSLGQGDRVPKTHPRIVAFGAVDELNASLGLAATHVREEALRQRILSIQNDLFDVGADLSCPPAEESGTKLRVSMDQVARLEEWIDESTERLAPLKSFVLPGGNRDAAHLHMARTICRRAESVTWAVAETSDVNPAVLQYLNRLSDLLFVWARQTNNNGETDVLWQPGAGSSSSSHDGK